MRSGLGVGHRDHRRTVAEHGNAAPARHQGAGGTDQLGQCQQLDVLGAGRLERLDGQHALGVPGQRHRRGGGQVQALTGQSPDGGDLRQQDTGHRDGRGGQLLAGGHRLVGGQRADPAQRLEADRPDDDEFGGDRLQQQFGLTGERGELGFDAGGGDQLFEGLQPRTALAAEGHGIGFAGVEPVDQGAVLVSLHRRAVTSSGGQPVVLVDRHRLSCAAAFLPARQESHKNQGIPAAIGY